VRSSPERPLTTTQQAGLAVGVAAIGSLFLSVAGGSGWGVATAVGLLVSALFMACAAVAVTRLRPGSPAGR
jgi:hypothetical protein